MLTYDPEADALYIRLSDKERDHTTSLDDERHIDYAADGTPVGVEFLTVSLGIDLRDIPEAEGIAALLESVRAVKVA